MNTVSYMEALGTALGMDVELSATGAAAFSLNGRGLLLQWQEANQSFVIYSEIGSLAGWRDGVVCRQLLAANYLLAQAEGGAFSYNEITNRVGLNYVLPVYGLEPEIFVKKLDAIIILSDQWNVALTRMCAEQEMAVARDQALMDADTDVETKSSLVAPLLRV